MAGVEPITKYSVLDLIQDYSQSMAQINVQQ